jgi:hypothetical protein
MLKVFTHKTRSKNSTTLSKNSIQLLKNYAQKRKKLLKKLLNQVKPLAKTYASRKPVVEEVIPEVTQATTATHQAVAVIILAQTTLAIHHQAMAIAPMLAMAIK